MLLFEFARALLRFNAQTPSMEPLFQLPPEIGAMLRRLPLLLFLRLLLPHIGNPAAYHPS